MAEDRRRDVFARARASQDMSKSVTDASWKIIKMTTDSEDSERTADRDPPPGDNMERNRMHALLTVILNVRNGLVPLLRLRQTCVQFILLLDGESGAESLPDCSICLEPMWPGCSIRSGCGNNHHFHVHCMYQYSWCRQQKVCPLCRGPLPETWDSVFYDSDGVFEMPESFRNRDPNCPLQKILQAEVKLTSCLLRLRNEVYAVAFADENESTSYTEMKSLLREKYSGFRTMMRQGVFELEKVYDDFISEPL